MASALYDAGSLGLQGGGGIAWATDVIKLMLIGTATPYTFARTQSVLTTAAASELSVTGYAPGFAGAGRATLATPTITDDSTNGRSVYKMANPAAWTLSTGGTVAAALIYKHITSDAASIPIAFLDWPDVPTNGGTFSIAFDAAMGCFYLQL